jgi:bacterioferritin
MTSKTAVKTANNDKQVKADLIDSLNEDLAGELSAITQYITYAAKVTGPYRPQLVEFFMKEVPDEQRHAAFLANKIVALGGEPSTKARPVDAEQRAVRDYTKRTEEAEEYGDKGLVVELENIVSDETGHAEETERILRDWPL